MINEEDIEESSEVEENEREEDIEESSEVEKSSEVEENESEEDIDTILAKLFVANGLNGTFIFAGVRKTQDGKYCLISDVKKNEKNFYIPIEKAKQYLEKKYNNGEEITTFEQAKQSIEKLLADIYEETKTYRFLGFDGICGYLGAKIDNLPNFDINDPQIDEKFQTVNLKFDDKKNYYVDKHPITLYMQLNTKEVQDCYSNPLMDVIKNGNYASICYLGMEANIIANIVNNETKNKDHKYCNMCNFTKTICDLNIDNNTDVIKYPLYRKSSFCVDNIEKIVKTEKNNKKLLNFSQKYLDTYRDGRMYFKNEIIIDDKGTKSKIYNGYKSMEHFYNLNSNNSKKQLTCK